MFKIRLKPGANSVFAPDAVIERTGGDTIPFDFDRIYGGHLEDDENALVSGMVTRDGLFDGTIATPNEVYYVEPASRYAGHLATSSHPDFHSVIYKESDVYQPPAVHGIRSGDVRENRRLRRSAEERGVEYDEDGDGRISVTMSMATLSQQNSSDAVAMETSSSDQVRIEIQYIPERKIRTLMP